MHARTWKFEALALALAMPALGLAQDAPVTGEEIQALWAGKELIGTTASGARFFMRFEKDGTASISVGNFNDTGHWRGSDTGYCAKWAVIRKGEERCFSAVRNGGKYRIIDPEGKLSVYVDAVR
jgi:hypothetical protein